MKPERLAQSGSCGTGHSGAHDGETGVDFAGVAIVIIVAAVVAVGRGYDAIDIIMNRIECDRHEDNRVMKIDLVFLTSTVWQSYGRQPILCGWGSRYPINQGLILSQALSHMAHIPVRLLPTRGHRSRMTLRSLVRSTGGSIASNLNY